MRSGVGAQWLLYLQLGTRCVGSQVCLSPTPVLIQEVESYLQNNSWNPNPEKILLAYLTNVQLFTIFVSEMQSFD